MADKDPNKEIVPQEDVDEREFLPTRPRPAAEVCNEHAALQLALYPAEVHAHSDAPSCMSSLTAGHTSSNSMSPLYPSLLEVLNHDGKRKHQVDDSEKDEEGTTAVETLTTMLAEESPDRPETLLVLEDRVLLKAGAECIREGKGVTTSYSNHKMSAEEKMTPAERERETVAPMGLHGMGVVGIGLALATAVEGPGRPAIPTRSDDREEDEEEAADNYNISGGGGQEAVVGTQGDLSQDTTQLARAHLVQQPSQEDLPIAQSVTGVLQGKERLFRQQMGCMVLALAVLVAGLVSAISVTVTRKKSQGNNGSFVAVDDRHRVGLAMKQKLTKVLGVEFFGQRNSPESKALEWLVREDPLQLDEFSSNLLQRFLVVYFYKAMTTKNQWRDCNPSSFDNGNVIDTDLCFYNALLGDGTFTVAYTPTVVAYDQVIATRWLTGAHECQWAGIFCNREDQRITHLHLDDMMLNGTFPVEMARLSSLESLSLTKNHISGTLPSELEKLTALTFIDLQYNKLIGGIPSGMFNLEALTHLNLAWNQLTIGTITTDIQKLTSLNNLFLDSCGITGTIPLELFGLTRLNWLSAAYNEISGRLPTELGYLTNLAVVSLDYTKLTSTIPTEIGLLTGLLELAAWGAQISGTIPEELFFSGNEVINALVLGATLLSGSISPNIKKLTSLGYLLLSSNPMMTGTIPTEMGLLKELRRFDIDGCGFTGTMPLEVCALRGDWGLSKLKADCLAISTGEIPLSCGESCCSRCCDQESGMCPKPPQRK